MQHDMVMLFFFLLISICMHHQHPRYVLNEAAQVGRRDWSAQGFGYILYRPVIEVTSPHCCLYEAATIPHCSVDKAGGRGQMSSHHEITVSLRLTSTQYSSIVVQHATPKHTHTGLYTQYTVR